MSDGMTTEELRPPEAGTKSPDLDKAERISKRIFFTGLGLDFLAYLAPLSAGTLTSGEAAYSSRSGAIFGTIATMALGDIAIAMTILGGGGWLLSKYLKPFWAATCEAIRGGERNRILVERLIIDTDERYRNVLGLVGAVPSRLNEVEERLHGLDDANKLLEDVLGRVKRVEAQVAPDLDYGAGVEHGLLLGRDARGDER